MPILSGIAQKAQSDCILRIVAVGSPPANADPIERLQYVLAHDPFELPSREEIRAALVTLLNFQAGESAPECLDGLPGWLDWLLVLPTEEGSTTEDVKVAEVVRAALQYVRSGRQSAANRPAPTARERRAAAAKWNATRSTADLITALEMVTAAPAARRRA